VKTKVSLKVNYLENNINKYEIIWRNQIGRKSGSAFSNDYFPKDIIKNIFDDKHSLFSEKINKIGFEALNVNGVNESVGNITGLRILITLQNLFMANHLTVFRVIRYPTLARLYNALTIYGLSSINYEQERLLSFYNEQTYKHKRAQIRKDKRFHVLPQERIVKGLPVFFNINDAVNIHSCFRRNKDLILIIVAFLPAELIFQKKLKIYSNRPIVKNYSDDDFDILVEDFILNNHKGVVPDRHLLDIKGINIYEVYLKSLPNTIQKCNSMKIENKFFLMELEKAKVNKKKFSINGFAISNNTMKKYENVFSSIWGDDDLLNRQKTNYLPSNCFELSIK
jgi:hypothetical protein